MKKCLFLIPILLALAACATTFNEKVAIGYTSATGARNTAYILLESDDITPDDAQNVQKQADTLREGIDIARQLNSESKLDSVLTGLAGLKKYLEDLK